MGGKEGRAAIAPLGLPACDGRRCLAHAGGGRILLPVITIPSVYASVHQRNTDLSVRRGLARVSASALHGVPCVPPSAAPSLRRGYKGAGWTTRQTTKCRNTVIQ